MWRKLGSYRQPRHMAPWRRGAACGALALGLALSGSALAVASDLPNVNDAQSATTQTLMQTQQSGLSDESLAQGEEPAPAPAGDSDAPPAAPGAEPASPDSVEPAAPESGPQDVSQPDVLDQPESGMDQPESGMDRPAEVGKAPSRAAAVQPLAAVLTPPTSLPPNGNATRTTPSSGNTIIRVTTGGTRQPGGSVGGLAGASFYAQQGTSSTRPVASATKYYCQYLTGNDGVCYIEVPDRTGSSNGYWVTQQSAPVGWLPIASIGTGNYDSGKTANPYQFFTGPVSGTGNTAQIPAADTNNTERVNGPVWANSLANPAMPSGCGLDIAMVVDRSASISSSEMTQFRNALQGFVGANGLGGTPSRAAVYTFSTTASKVGGLQPIGAQALTTNINSATADAGSGYTNWDAALAQVSNDAEPYDLVLFLTDGDPTTYRDGSDDNTTVRFRQVAEAVFSANQLKATGSTILGVGVGLSTNSDLNMRAITGPGNYYLASNWSALAATLKQIATDSCGGVISFEKQAVDQAGNRILPNPVLTNGIMFTLSATNGAVVDPSMATGVLNGLNGWAQAQYVLPTSVTETEITIVEAPSFRFSFRSISCTVDGKPTGTQIANGIKLTATPNAIVSCAAKNVLLPTVTVTKNWIVDGTEYPNTATLPADSPIGAASATLLLGPAPQITGSPAFGTEYVYPTTVGITVGETMSGVPQACEVSTTYASTTSGVSIGQDGKVGALKNGSNEFVITNEIQCPKTAALTLAKTVDNRHAGALGSGGADWTLTALAQTGTDPLKVTGPGAGAGQVVEQEIPAGTYLLSEAGKTSKETNGYRLTGLTCGPTAGGTFAGSFEQTVVGGQLTGGILTVDAGDKVVCTFTNESLPGSARWTKVDQEGNPLAMAEWTLTGPTADKTTAVLDCVATDPNPCAGPDTDPRPGHFTVEGLGWGTYTLTESAAPAGYLLDASEHTFVISHSGLDYEAESGFVNVQRPGVTLPLTGGASTESFAMVGIGLLALAGVYAAGTSRRRRAPRS